MYFIVKKKKNSTTLGSKKKRVIFIFLKCLNLNPSRPTTIQVATWTIIEKKPYLSLSKGL